MSFNCTSEGCTKQCTSAKSLSQHKYAQHGAGAEPATCGFVGCGFSATRFEVTQHERRCPTQGTETCDVCNTQHANKHALSRHKGSKKHRDAVAQRRLVVSVTAAVSGHNTVPRERFVAERPIERIVLPRIVLPEHCVLPEHADGEEELDKSEWDDEGFGNMGGDGGFGYSNAGPHVNGILDLVDGVNGVNDLLNDVNSNVNAVNAVNAVNDLLNGANDANAGVNDVNAVNGRVSDVNGVNDRVDGVNGVNGRANAVNDVNGRVNAVNAVNGRVNGVNDVNGRVSDVNGVNGHVNAVNAVNGRVNAVNGVNGGVNAVNAVNGRVNAVNAVNGHVNAVNAVNGRVNVVNDVNILDVFSHQRMRRVLQSGTMQARFWHNKGTNKFDVKSTTRNARANSGIKLVENYVQWLLDEGSPMVDVTCVMEQLVDWTSVDAGFAIAEALYVCAKSNRHTHRGSPTQFLALKDDKEKSAAELIVRTGFTKSTILTALAMCAAMMRWFTYCAGELQQNNVVTDATDVNAVNAVNKGNSRFNNVRLFCDGFLQAVTAPVKQLSSFKARLTRRNSTANMELWTAEAEPYINVLYAFYGELVCMGYML